MATEKLSWSRRFGEWLNPITIKELRQAVNGRFINAVFLIFLLIQLAIIGSVVMLSSDISQNYTAGRDIFIALFSVLYITGMLFLPAYAALRFASERSDNHTDLFFITSLTPAQIIAGKLQASVALTILFFSATLPFMTLTYLLRGIDIPTMFTMMVFVFFTILAAMQFGIFVASAPGTTLSRGVRFAGALILLLFFSSYSIGGVFGMLTFGNVIDVGSSEFWAGAGTSLLGCLMVTGLFFVVATANVSPPTANRALPVRVYLLVLWIVTAVVDLVYVMVYREDEILLPWLVFNAAVFSIAPFVAICERRQWGPRLVKSLSATPLKRLLVFPLYSGVANGIVFSVMMMLLTLLVVVVVRQRWVFGARLSSEVGEAMVTAGIVYLYAFCYAVSGYLISRLPPLSYSQRHNLPVIVALLLAIVGTFVPWIVWFLTQSHGHDIDPEWLIANPLVLSWEYRKMLTPCSYFVVIWTVLLLVPGIPWFFRRLRAFRPDSPDCAEVAGFGAASVAVPVPRPVGPVQADEGTAGEVLGESVESSSPREAVSSEHGSGLEHRDGSDHGSTGASGLLEQDDERELS